MVGPKEPPSENSPHQGMAPNPSLFLELPLLAQSYLRFSIISVLGDNIFPNKGMQGLHSNGSNDLEI